MKQNLKNMDALTQINKDNARYKSKQTINSFFIAYVITGEEKYLQQMLFLASENTPTLKKVENGISQINAKEVLIWFYLLNILADDEVDYVLFLTEEILKLEDSNGKGVLLKKYWRNVLTLTVVGLHLKIVAREVL